MNRTQIPTPHHELSFGGMAPWPLPGKLSMADIQADPAARCCKECGRRLLLLLLQSSSWVSHRTEHVSFRDDRSVVRRVTVGWHTEFDWDSTCEDQLITALERQSSATHGPVPSHCLVLAR